MKKAELKVLYLFAGERRKTIEQWQRGEMPDSYLIGLNHMVNYNIEASYIETSFINWLRKKNFNLANLILIPRLKNYDVVFCGGSLFLPFVYKYILRIKKPKLVWYNTFFTNTIKRNKRGLKGWIIRKTITSLDAIVCPSTAQRDFLISEGFDKNKIFYIQNGIDFDFINSHKKDGATKSEKPFILSVGKDLGRDYPTFIEAIKDLDIKVKIVALPRNFKNIAELPKNTEVISNVPFPDLLELYKKALFVVIPTKSEKYLGSSDCSGQYVLLDAMAAGKAIIASERETLNDYITNGVDVLLVPPEDPLKLRESIVKLMNDPNLNKSLGDNAKEKLRGKFTTKILAGELDRLFKEVASIS
jgi:glycosyltransferase involved in cell wall biosynthesis